MPTLFFKIMTSLSRCKTEQCAQELHPFSLRVATPFRPNSWQVGVLKKPCLILNARSAGLTTSKPGEPIHDQAAVTSSARGNARAETAHVDGRRTGPRPSGVGLDVHPGLHRHGGQEIRPGVARRPRDKLSNRGRID